MRSGREREREEAMGVIEWNDRVIDLVDGCNVECKEVTRA